MRAFCVARHPMLSEHLCRFFDGLGIDTVACVGLRETADAARADGPDLVICDYDLLMTPQADELRSDAAMRDVPVIAVSLTHRPADLHALEAGGIAGFLYLPTLDPEEAQRVLGAVRRLRGGINPPNVLSWPAPTPAARSR